MVVSAHQSAVGVIDGSNRFFETVTDYKTGSLKVWRNGIGDQIITELGSKKFEFAVAPIAGDTIAVRYIPI